MWEQVDEGRRTTLTRPGSETGGFAVIHESAGKTSGLVPVIEAYANALDETHGQPEPHNDGSGAARSEADRFASPSGGY